EAFALAEKIVAMSPLAVTACLGSVTRGINVPIDEGLAIEASYFARMVPTRDIQEGISAFLEKRAPQFTGTERLADRRPAPARPPVATHPSRSCCRSGRLRVTKGMQPGDVRTAADAVRIVEERKLDHVKLGVFDLDGVLRGKYLNRDKFFSALENGFGFCDVVLGWDSNDQLYD